MARALNFAIFTAALYTFGRYWRAVADWSKRINRETAAIPAGSPLVWMLIGYLLFVVNFARSVEIVNPDILVAAIAFAIAAFLFRLHDDSRHGIGAYACLGLLLAMGYYAKAILLYFAVFVLAAIVVRGFRSRQFRGPIVALVVFFALVSPFVTALSRAEGHFTAGDSGRLNYAWFVDGPETKSWMVDSSASAPIPFYPGAIVFDSPRVFRLPSIAGVTYAPWYDAARFDKGDVPSFDFRKQIRQLLENLRYPREEILGAGAALSVPLLILVWYSPRASLRNFAATWFCTLPTAAVIGMYLLVHLVPRFVLGFSLILWGAAFASAAMPRGLQLLARRATLAGCLVFAAYAIPGLLHYVISPRTESVGLDLAIAGAMSHYGIAAGDPVASIGNGEEAYWAHFAEVRVVAEVWSNDSARFWSAQPVVQQAALGAMADAGAKVVVWRRDSDQSCPSQWLALPENSGCIIPLR